MYTKPVGEIIKWHNIKYLCCADDAQGALLQIHTIDGMTFYLQLKVVLKT